MNASEWLKQNDPKQKTKHRTGNGPKGKHTRCRWPREIRVGRKQLGSVKRFVERHRDHESSDCIFVPGSMDGVPATVTFCGRNISAARYMCLLTNGTPPTEGMVVRHKCGNGHLSCVNPNHLLWGTQGDNIGDMTKHRHAGDDVQDKIDAIDG